MTERKLKEYFEGNLTAEQLALDLRDSQKKTSYDVVSVYVEQIADGEFEIKTEHLIRLCNDAITAKLSPTDLNTIAFTLITSDFSIGIVTHRKVSELLMSFLIGTIQKLVMT